MLEELVKRQRTTQSWAGDSSRHTESAVASLGKPAMQSIGESLLELWRFAKSNGLDATKVEIEVRTGMVLQNDARWKAQVSQDISIQTKQLGLEFKVGMDETHCEGVRRCLAASKDTFSAQPQVQRYDTTGNRWDIDSANNVVKGEMKSKLLACDVAMLAYQYDLRLAIATETSVPIENCDRRFVKERFKRRASFRPTWTSCWQIDLTEVDTFDLSSRSDQPVSVSKDIELEFELRNSTVQRWCSMTTEKESVEFIRGLSLELMKLVDFCIQSNSEIPPKVPMAPCDLSMNSFVIDATTRLKAARDYPPGRGLDFVGSMPLNLSRRGLLSLHRSNYFLTEKSDGLRYLLYVVKDEVKSANAQCEVGAVVLMNRAKELVQLPGGSVLAAALGIGTVLDGELVYNLTKRSMVFLVFDALSFCEQPCLQLSFGQRLNVLREKVFARYSKYVSDNASYIQENYPHLLPMVLKNFVPKSRLGDMLSKIRFEGGEKIFHDGEYRHHKTDGIIFQPDKPYSFYTSDVQLMKWKWSDMRSVDLLVGNKVYSDRNQGVSPTQQGRATSVMLYCNGPQGILVDCTKRGADHVGLGFFDTMRLLGDCRDPTLREGTPRIAEVAYDVGVGMWRYCHLRRDKTEPNFIDTVMGVMLEQAEAISIEELEYCLLAQSDSQLDFGVRLQKLKTQLLDWRKNEQGKHAESKSRQVKS